MDEIKSLSFHIMFYRLFRGVVKYIVYGNTLSDSDHYTPRDGRQNEHNTSSLLNEDYICSMDTDFKHCRFKTNTNNRAICVRRLFLCERSTFSFTQTLNNYINTLICIRIPVFASILVNTEIKVLRESKRRKRNTYRSYIRSRLRS